MTPVFAFLTDAKEALTELVTGLLMVAGGFLVGYILGGIDAWAAGRYLLKQKDPEVFKRVGRPVGGVVLALIVALIVFTGKGKPLGEGGDGKGNPDTDPNARSGTPPVPHKNDPDIKLPKTPEVKLADATLRVTVLGGTDVREGRFYLIDDDRTPKTFDEFKQAVTARKAAEKGKLMVAILFPAKNALPLGHPAVVDLSRWVNEEAKLDVLFPTIK
jgi:hypothetical protein